MIMLGGNGWPRTQWQQPGSNAYKGQTGGGRYSQGMVGVPLSPVETGGLGGAATGTSPATGGVGGLALNSTIAEEGIAVTLVYVDATKGWLVTDSGLQSEAPGPEFIAATGGTITTVCTNFKVHTFTSPGTFCVSSKGNVAGSSTIDYLVVGGGGGGGNGPNFANMGAGGGAGGYRESAGTDRKSVV